MSLSLLGNCCGRLASRCWELRHQLEHALNKEAADFDGRPMENQLVSCSKILRSAPRITGALKERRSDLVILGLDET